MKRYLEKVKRLKSQFHELDLKRISQAENKSADVLSKLVSLGYSNKTIMVELLKYMSIDEMEIDQVELINGWKKPVYDFLSKGVLPT